MTRLGNKMLREWQNHRSIILLLLVLAFPQTSYSQTKYDNISDKEKLNKAVDYFQSGKYHESIILFKQLEKRFNLNYRFRAYMGVCYYYDHEYRLCDSIISYVSDKLEVFAPHERSVYYYCAAVSSLETGKLKQAINYFEKTLLLCYNNEKGNILGHIAKCYLGLDKVDVAQEYLLSAKAYINSYGGEWTMQKLEREIRSCIGGRNDDE